MSGPVYGAGAGGLGVMRRKALGKLRNANGDSILDLLWRSCSCSVGKGTE